jgi:hypothetical protein
MKNITKSLLVLMGVMALSCNTDDVEDRPVIQQGTGLELQAPVNGTGYQLLIENQALQAERFVWTEADFGQDVVVTYTVEIDKAGDNFDTPQSLGSVPSATQLSVSTASLNSAALNLEGEPGVAANYDVRVKATINDTFEPMYSNSIQVSVTPYALFVPVQDLFLVGNATEHDWNNNANNAPLFRDADNQYLYYFTGYFNAGGFKILSDRGSWHPQYGSVSDGILGVSNADGSNEPGQIMVASAGYYQLTVNTDEMTYSLVPYDVSGAPAFSSVGIIGDATPGGWDSDTNLTNSAAQPHLWRAASVALTDAKVKFRANDSWDLPGNWGGGASPIQGVTSVNGGDFQGVFLAGNYEIWFNDLDGRYIFMEAE